MKPTYIFSFLCVLFLGFSFSIYIQPFASEKQQQEVNPQAGEGKLVWQKYNCQSCHQLFGLGGYLGPDLSNITSAEGKSPAYISALIRSGTAQMPAFDLSPEEESLLLEFLKAADASGPADPRSFNILSSGMISRK